MSAMENVAPDKNVIKTKTLIRALVGAVIGAVFGAGSVSILFKLHVISKHTSWADTLALCLGEILFVLGLVTYVISFNRRELARNLEGMSAKLPATEAEVRVTRLQCASLLLGGILILLPLFSVGLPGRPVILFAAIVVLFGIQTAVNLLIWRSSDEFQRRLLLLASGIAFAIGQGTFFLWAAAERLHLAPTASTWDMITVLLTLYLGISAYLSVRNRPSF